MRSLLLFIAFVPLFLLADLFPQTSQHRIVALGEQSVMLDEPIPVTGMSGVVVHDYGNDLKAVSAYIVREKEGHKILKETSIKHPKMPTVKTEVQNEDIVISGYLYDNVLVLAPDEKTYNAITTGYNKNWIHPDLFAVFLASEGETAPTKELLKKFALQNQVGLVVIVQKGKAVALDPISAKHVGSIKLTTKTQADFTPFYHRIKNLDAGLFARKKPQDYYTIMQEL